MITESKKDECVCCGVVVVTVAAMFVAVFAMFLPYSIGKSSGYATGYREGVAWGGTFMCHSGNALKRLGEEGR